MMRTANPALNAGTFENLERYLANNRAGSAEAPAAYRAMTIYGTAHKTLILLAIAFFAAGFTWNKFRQYADPETGIRAMMPWALGFAIAGFLVAVVTIMGNKKWAMFSAPVYAILEGLFLGAVSVIFESFYTGIVIQAVGLTLCVAIALLLAYISRLIKPTENFKLGVCAATGGIALLYLVSWIMSMFGLNLPYIHAGGPIGIGFSVVVCIIAALNLVLDFDFIEEGAKRGAPKYMEWYAAFGLMITLVWLYLEILRLLSKMRRD